MTRLLLIPTVAALALYAQDAAKTAEPPPEPAGSAKPGTRQAAAAPSQQTRHRAACRTALEPRAAAASPTARAHLEKALRAART